MKRVITFVVAVGGEANAPFMPVNEMAALFVKSKEGLARAAELATPYVPQAQQPTVVVHDDSEHSTGSNSNMVKAHVKPVDASGSHDKAGHSRDWPPDPLTRTEFANPGWRSFVVRCPAGSDLVMCHLNCCCERSGQDQWWAR